MMSMIVGRSAVIGAILSIAAKCACVDIGAKNMIHILGMTVVTYTIAIA